MRRVPPPYLGAALSSVVVALVFPLTLLHAQLPVEEPSWSRQFGTPQPDQANGIAVLDGNVYVVGDVIGALPGESNEFPQEKSGFLRKYDYQGKVVWTRSIGNNMPNEDSVTSVAATAGAVYVAGWTRGVLGPQRIGTEHEAFVSKYDLNGTLQWTQQFGTTAGDEANGVAADASGVYVAGFVECCGAPLNALGSTGTDAFVRKYSPEGAELWTRQFGSVDVDRATAITVDATGVYVVGTTNGAFVPGRLGQQDGFLAKFGKDGTTLLSKQFGTTDYNEEANAVAVGPSGIYIGGRTTGALEGKMPAGLWDGYVMQFNSDGILQWTRQIAGPGDGDNVQGLAVGLTHLLVTGAADGSLSGQPFVGGSDAFYRLYDFNGVEASTREFGNGLNDWGSGAAADLRAFYIVGSKEGNALGLTPVGDNDAFVTKMAPKPLDKEDVKLPAGPRGTGGRGAGRTGRAGRGN